MIYLHWGYQRILMQNIMFFFNFRSQKLTMVNATSLLRILWLDDSMMIANFFFKTMCFNVFDENFYHTFLFISLHRCWINFIVKFSALQISYLFPLLKFQVKCNLLSFTLELSTSFISNSRHAVKLGTGHLFIASFT